MCEEHIWRSSGCSHTSRSKNRCEDARRAQRKAESGCCGLWATTPKKVCEVRYTTHYDARLCRQCQKAARESSVREAREVAKARAAAKQAAARYGWETAATSGGNRRDSHIDSGLYGQAVNILPESEYRQYMPAPPGRSATGRTTRGAAAGSNIAMVPLRPPPAVTRGQVRRGTNAANGPPPPAMTRGQSRRGTNAANGPGDRTGRTFEARLQARGQIRDSYHNIIRSAGLPLPLPRQEHEGSDEYDEPLPDDDFLAMVSRAG